MSGRPGLLSNHVILQIVPTLGPGGAEQGCVDVARAIVAAGGTALVASAGGSLAQELVVAGGELIVMPVQRKTPWAMAGNIGALRRIVVERGVHLVHARSRAPAWSGLAAARRAGVPFVTTFHAAYNFNNGLKRLYNSVMARGDRVIAISHFIADHVQLNYGVGADRLRVIPRGIDLQRFDPAAVTPDRIACLRRHYGLDAAKRLVFMPARLSRSKGHLHLLEALARLGFADWQALLVGPDAGRGEMRRQLIRHAETLGIADRVRVAPHCADMPAAYAMADVVVVASVQPEGFGRVPVEAQAMGRPVIATRVGALPELVDPGVTGWLVPPADPIALAHALTEVLTLVPEARTALATAVRATRAHYGVGAMTTATLQLYAELLFPPDGGESVPGGGRV